MSTFTVKPLDKTKELEEADAILLQAVIRYRELQANIIFLQNEMKGPRAIIEQAANAAPDRKIVTPQFKISLTETWRENFDKKAAIEALGKKKLSPFISTTKFYQLRVS